MNGIFEEPDSATPLTPEEREEKKAAQAKEEKSKKKAPTLLRPGETVKQNQ